MNRRKTVAANVALALFAACVAARPAAAQLHDHLQCYKVKDTAAFTAIANLIPASGSPFDVAPNCTIKVHSRQLCFPVEKDLVSSHGPQLAVSGQELENAFVCYTVKCSGESLPSSLEMSDQFGTRTFTGLHTSTICAPAIAGVPPTTTTLPPPVPRSCVDATPPNCDGTCNNYNFACASDGLGSCYCEYVDVFGGCPMIGSGVPNCYGTCEGMNTCIEVAGACQCGFAY